MQTHAILRVNSASVAISLALSLGWLPVQAAELKAGTVIEKSNIDAIKNDTFDGHTVASLLTEKVEWQIREWGLRITLDHAKPIPLDPRFAAATKKYSDQVKFDTNSKEITGYVAGYPFADISSKDPDAAYKLVWNFYYAPNMGDVFYNKYFVLGISADRGLETKQDWVLMRYYMKNRLLADKPVAGDGTEIVRTINLGLGPEDVKGIGTLSVRYDAARFDDYWAYLKTARRIRRLSGGAWMDPVGGSDILNDDLDLINARPSWYKSMKLLGKRWILAVSDAREDIWNPAKKGTPEEFPAIDIKNFPHWNPIQKWQPREVYVVEATPPPEHPYSKRMLYMDVNYYRPYYTENYDKKGDFWKFVNGHARPIVSEGGLKMVALLSMDFIDFKSKHATSVPIYGHRADPKGVVTMEQFTLGGLEQLSR